MFCSKLLYLVGLVFFSSFLLKAHLMLPEERREESVTGSAVVLSIFFFFLGGGLSVKTSFPF